MERRAWWATVHRIAKVRCDLATKPPRDKNTHTHTQKKKTSKTKKYQKHSSIIHESESCSVMSDSLWPHELYDPWNSPGQNTGMGSLSLLQKIFPAHGSNPGLLHCRQILYQLSHKRSPRIPKWVAYPYSRGSSQHRNWTGVSCIAGRFFTNWAMRKAHSSSFITSNDEFIYSPLNIRKDIFD